MPPCGFFLRSRSLSEERLAKARSKALIPRMALCELFLRLRSRPEARTLFEQEARPPIALSFDSAPGRALRLEESLGCSCATCKSLCEWKPSAWEFLELAWQGGVKADGAPASELPGQCRSGPASR
jgi:hypothetical protein